MPYIGKGANGFGIRERYRYSASGSQTAFTGSDLDSKTLQIDSGSLVDVYLNGVLLDTADYNTNTANQVTLTSGATASDEVMIVVYDVFSLSDAMPKTGGTFTGGISGTTGTFSGIIKTDDTTDATSTTDGSLQTDGGLSVAKDAVIGNDLLMKSDASAIKFGADSEMVLTHSADAGLTLLQTASAGSLLTLGTTSTSVSDDAFIGGIDFASGSSPTVNARMHARQEGTSENGGKIEFETRREGGSLLKSAKIDDEGRFSVASDGLVGRNQIVSQYTVSVGTSATSIADTTRFRTYGTFFVVSGRDHNSSANRFVDILVASLNGSVVVVSGNTVRGSPASRSYSNTSERLNLTMGGGSYTVGVMAFDFNTGGNSAADGDD